MNEEQESKAREVGRAGASAVLSHSQLLCLQRGTQRLPFASFAQSFRREALDIEFACLAFSASGSCKEQRTEWPGGLGY